MTKDEAQAVLIDRIEAWLENEHEYIGATLGRYQQGNPKEALQDAEDDDERYTLERYLETVEAYNTLTDKEWPI